ncbi:MAG: hypothetical protein KDC71_01840, partial [Acidobacteria bacterium]|nr:hypothetical protein [Acidobacteriota bacterium]
MKRIQRIKTSLIGLPLLGLSLLAQDVFLSGSRGMNPAITQVMRPLSAPFLLPLSVRDQLEILPVPAENPQFLLVFGDFGSRDPERILLLDVATGAIASQLEPSQSDTRLSGSARIRAHALPGQPGFFAVAFVRQEQVDLRILRVEGNVLSLSEAERSLDMATAQTRLIQLNQTALVGPLTNGDFYPLDLSLSETPATHFQGLDLAQPVFESQNGFWSVNPDGRLSAWDFSGAPTAAPAIPASVQNAQTVWLLPPDGFAYALTPQSPTRATLRQLRFTTNGLQTVAQWPVDNFGHGNLHYLAGDSFLDEGASSAISVKIDQPASGFITKAPTLDVTGHVSGPVTDLNLNGQALSLNNDTFATTLSPPEGPLTLTAIASSDSGSAQDSVSGLIDRTPPSITILSPAPGSVVFSQPVVLNLVLNDTYDPQPRLTLGNQQVQGNGQHAITLAGLSEGSNSVVLFAVDHAGNENRLEYLITVQTQNPPSARLDVPNAALRGDTIQGTAYLDQGTGTVILPDGSSLAISAGATPFTYPVNPWEPQSGLLFQLQSSLPPVSATTQLQDPPILFFDLQPTSGLITGQSQVVLSGRVQPQWVHLFGPDGSPVSVSAQGTFQHPQALAAGPNSFQFRAELVASQQLSPAINIYSDRTPPQVMIQAPSQSYPGQSIALQLSATDDTRIDSITLSMDGTPLQSWAPASATWSTTYTLPIDCLATLGNHDFSLQAIDRVQNTNTAQHSLVLIQPDLNLTVTTTAGQIVTQPNFTVTGTITPAEAIVRFNGNPVQQNGQTWQITIPLSEGPQDLAFSAEFACLTAQQSLAVDLDTTPPAIDLQFDPPSGQQGQAVTVSWSATDRNGIASFSLKRGSETLSDQPSGSLALPVPIDANLSAWSFTAEATDQPGNAASPLQANLNLQPIVFSVALSEPSPDSLTNQAQITASGTVSHAGATVTVNGQPATVQDTNWSINLPLSGEGNLPIQVEASLNGYQANTSGQIFRDITPPQVDLQIAATLQQGETIDAVWTASDNHALDTVRVYHDQTLIGETQTGTFHFEIPYQPDLTELHLWAEATDMAGNQSQPEWHIPINPIAFQVVIDSPTEGLRTNQNPLTVTGTVNPADPAVTITVDGTPATVTGNTWTVSIPLAADGPHTLTAQGQLGGYAHSPTRNLILDTTPPSIQITAPAQVEQGSSGSFSWVVEDLFLNQVDVQFQGVSIAQTPTGSHTFTPPLDPALLQALIQITADDGLNPPSSDSASIDTPVPQVQVAITSPSPAFETRLANLTISGTVSPADTPVTVNGTPALVTGTS